MSTNAPWERLTMFMTPHTSEKPTPTSASSPPSSSPFTVAWRNCVTRVLRPSIAPARPLQLCLRLVVGVDRDGLAVRDLDRGHRLLGVRAGGVELDRTEERVLVQPRERRTHLRRISRPGLLHAEDECQARGRRLGAVVLGTLAEALLILLRVVLGRPEDLVPAGGVRGPLR